MGNAPSELNESQQNALPLYGFQGRLTISIIEDEARVIGLGAKWSDRGWSACLKWE